MSQKMWNLKGDASTVSTDSSGKSLLSLPTSDKTAPQTRSLWDAGVVFSSGYTGTHGEGEKAQRAGLAHDLSKPEVA